MISNSLPQGPIDKAVKSFQNQLLKLMLSYQGGVSRDIAPYNYYY